MNQEMSRLCPRIRMQRSDTLKRQRCCLHARGCHCECGEHDAYWWSGVDGAIHQAADRIAEA